MAAELVIARRRKPAICHKDQISQFTSTAFTDVQNSAVIAITLELLRVALEAIDWMFLYPMVPSRSLAETAGARAAIIADA